MTALSILQAPPAPVAARSPKTSSERLGPYVCGALALLWLATPVIGFQNVLTLLTVLSLVAAFLGLLVPTIGLFAVGVLCTIDPLTRVFLLTGGLLRWNTFNYLLVVVTILSAPVLLRVRDIHTRLAVALVAFCVLGLAYSTDMRNGILSLLNLGSLLGLTIYYVRAAWDKNIHLWLGMANGLCAALSGVAFHIYRFSLPTINPNAWSWVPLTGLFSICLGYTAARRGSLAQVLLGVLAVANVVFAFLSTSRGAMLISAACLAYLLLQTSGAAVRITVIVSGVLLVAALLASFSERGKVASHRLMKLFDDEYTAAERTSGRSDMAEAGVDVFLSNPLGVGTGAFKKEFSKLDVDLGVAGMERNAHSAWIMMLAENGVLGFLLLTAYIFSFALQGFIHRRRGLLGVGVLVTAGLASAFVSREFQGKGPWLLSAGGAALMTQMYRNNRGKMRQLPRPWTPRS